MKRKIDVRGYIFVRSKYVRALCITLAVAYINLNFVNFLPAFQLEAYRIQEGDKVDISALGGPSEYYVVPPDGRLFIPTLGYRSVLDLRNKTIFDVAKDIEELQTPGRPTPYRVKIVERYQGDVNVLGASKIIGKQRSDTLMAILSNSGYDLEKWNENIRVCFSDTNECKIYKYKYLENSPQLSPYVPRGSTVFLSERTLYRKMAALKPAYPWIGGIISGIVIALVLRNTSK